MPRPSFPTATVNPEATYHRFRTLANQYASDGAKRLVGKKIAEDMRAAGWTSINNNDITGYVQRLRDENPAVGALFEVRGRNNRGANLRTPGSDLDTVLAWLGRNHSFELTGLVVTRADGVSQTLAIQQFAKNIRIESDRKAK